MHCWWGSLCWPCSWTSQAFKASDLYFWPSSWWLEIELEPCFCGSPGCRVPQAQWYPLQVCGSEPTYLSLLQPLYILHSQLTVSCHSATCCSRSSTCAHFVQVPPFLQKYLEYPWKPPVLTPASPVLSASGFSGAVSVDTLALAQECPPLRQRLKALSTYLRCGSTFIIIINYNYYVFLTAVNRVVEVPFFGHCNSSHLLPKKTVKPGICLCAAFKKSGLNQTSFISVLS